MTHFHAVMSFMGVEEFGAEVEASSHEEAYELLSEMYPESSIVQLESPDDTRARQMAIYASIHAEEYGDFEDDDWDDYTDEERAELAQACAERAEEW
jgi:hypothetical protein